MESSVSKKSSKRAPKAKSVAVKSDETLREALDKVDENSVTLDKAISSGIEVSAKKKAEVPVKKKLAQTESKGEEVVEKPLEFSLKTYNRTTIDLKTITKDEVFRKATAFDFSGFENLTDYGVYCLAKYFNSLSPAAKSKIDFGRISFNGCKNLTIWSLHHLNQIHGKTLYDTLPSEPTIKKRFAACDKISTSLTVSLEFNQSPGLLDEYNLLREAKILVINEAHKPCSLLNYLRKTNSKPTSGEHAKRIFDFEKLNVQNKTLNIFECTESLANVLLSERNMVVLTFNLDDPLEEVESSLKNRMLKVISQNVLPSSILCLGIQASKSDQTSSQEKLKNLEKSLNDEILKLKEDTLKAVNEFLALDLSDEVSFQSQIMASNHINMMEQLKMLPKQINFITIDPNAQKDTIINQLIQVDEPNEESSLEMAKTMEDAQKTVWSLNKSDIVELKVFAKPPQAVQVVGEAFCIMFREEPKYDSFKKLISSTDIMDRMLRFDYESITPKMINQLEKYIKMPEFNPETLSKISTACRGLCVWILAAHRIYKLKQEMFIQNAKRSASSSYSSLLAFMHQNAHYSFAWPFYYQQLLKSSDLSNQKVGSIIAKINQLLEKHDFKSKPFMSIDEFVSSFQDNFDLYTTTYSENFRRFPQKYAISQHAKGNLLYDRTRNSRFLITDIPWLVGLIGEISNAEIKENFPVWTISSLKTKLNKFKIEGSAQNDLIDYLCDLNILTLSNTPGSDLLLNINQLEPEVSDAKLTREWPKVWNGHEYSTTWQLKTPLAQDAFTMFMKYFFGENKTLLLWSSGMINSEAGCFVMIAHSNKKLKLAVRVIDPNKLFKPEKKIVSHVKNASFIFMEYYFVAKYIIQQFSIACELKFKDGKNCGHPLMIAESPEKSDGDKKLKSLIDKLAICDRNYYNTYFSCRHDFDSTNVEWIQKVHCSHCSLNLKRALEWREYYRAMYPAFDSNSYNYVVHRGNERLIPLIRVKGGMSFQRYTSWKMEIASMTEAESGRPYFEIEISKKSIEPGGNPNKMIFVLLLEKLAYSENHQNVSPDDELENHVILKSTKLQKFDLNTTLTREKFDLDYCIEVRLEHSLIGSNQCELSVFKNAEKIMTFDIENPSELNIMANFGVEPWNNIEESPSWRTSSFVITTNQMAELKPDRINSLDALIGSRLEARDRKNPHLCCVATIIDTNDNNEVLIHFDGWSDRFDYWTDLGHEDLLPCGFMDYWKKKNNQTSYSYKQMRSMEPPKGQPRTFKWIEYLRKENLTSLPLEFFNDEQKAGMQTTDFQGTSIFQPSCSDQINPRCEFNRFTNAIEKVKTESASILQIVDDSSGITQTSRQRRGLVIFPNNPSKEFLESPTIDAYDTQFKLHLFCLNAWKLDLTSNTSIECYYSHLLDTKGIDIDRDVLDQNDFDYLIMSFYFLSIAQNPIIIPFYEKIFPGVSESVESDTFDDDLQTNMRKFFKQFFESYLLYGSSVLKTTVALAPVEVGRFLNKLDEETKSSEEYKIENHVCSYCYKARTPGTSRYSHLEIPLEKKLENKYSMCASEFSISSKDERSPSRKEKFIMDKKFIKHYQNLRQILLADCQLEFDAKIDKYVDKFSLLCYIELRRNQITSIPSSLLKIASLKYLKIANNPIRSFCDGTAMNLETWNRLLQASKLETLVLDRIPLSEEELFNADKTQASEKLKLVFPATLSCIIFKETPLGSMPFDLSSAKQSITQLQFSGIPFLDATQYGGVNAMVREENIQEKLAGFLTRDQISALYSRLDTTNRGFLNNEEIVKLNAFIYKKFSRLGKKKVYLGGIPPDVFKLTNLTILNLSSQAIQFIPDEIENLKNLNTLKLDDCIYLSSISAKISFLPIGVLCLDNCISLKTPPPEVVRRGLSSIMAFLKRLSAGSVLCKRTKLMLVGLGEAGKTSLLNALTNQDASEEITITDGIDIKDWSIDLKDETFLTFSMWDFAGQSVYYNTHQFFLSSRAVYLLVWNVRLGSEYAGLEFWLSSISCHAPGAPIFVVGTHIDQVSKYSIDKEDLKSRFKSIVDFFFVSSITREGIEELTQKLIEVTLKQKYIGEKIPEAYLNFESMVKEMSEYGSLQNYTSLVKAAENCGIYEPQEVHQAIRFLNDLGSLQYFENNGLKDKVVINPQWIIDVMTCVVSVQETSVVEGKLLYDDIHKIWSRYADSLHDWILKLTEEFDLTFPVQSQKMSIVPCLLPEKAPAYEWPDINEANSSLSSQIKLKEFRVIYDFVYLPPGLFNRIQVRLYQYADSSTIWKNGSLLRKNSHLALLIQTKKSSIEVKVQGVKPENIIFVIHEVVETLINESFYGIQYDYSFPCPDCVNNLSSEPFMFSSSLLRRAIDLKAPFLQCQRFFHAISVQEMLSIMPVETTSSLDLNLEYSLRDLKQLKSNLKYDIAFWYCANDVPTAETKDKCIDPNKVLETLKNEQFKTWYSKNPKDEKFDQITLAMKESKMVILGISDEFAKDEKCLQVFELVKNIIKKNYLLIEFGVLGAHKWLTNPTFASVCTDYRVIMQDPNRFAPKIAEVYESLDRLLKDSKTDKKVDEEPPDVFISYCWANSHDAIKKGSKPTKTSLGWADPRDLVGFFKKHNITAWLDITQASTAPGLFGEITKGMNAASVIVACLSDEYAQSKNCLLEFRFAHCSLKVPIVKAIVGLGNEWKKHEISFLSGSYPEVNFQYENPNAYNQLLELVKEELDKVKDIKKKKANSDKEAEKQMIENQNAAFQELYELTQRKFLKQLGQFCDKMVPNSTHYPRLFCVELANKEHLRFHQSEFNRETASSNDEKSREAMSKDDLDRQSLREDPNSDTEDSVRKSTDSNNFTARLKSATKVSRRRYQEEDSMTPCIRPMCEFEEGWHLAPCFLAAEDLLTTARSQFSSYLARVMNILKNGNLSTELMVFISEKGNKLLSDLEGHAKLNDNDMSDSYTALRKRFIAEFDKKNVVPISKKDVALKEPLAKEMLSEEINQAKTQPKLTKYEIIGLQRCEMKNGKTLWLCEKHAQATGCKILDDFAETVGTGNDDSDKLLKNIDSIDINIPE